MLKTIKTTKQMRLDELIKYVWDNGITNTTFKSNYSAIVRINEYGDVSTTKFLHRNDSYTVEIEEDINNTTIFKSVVGVLNNDEIMLTNMHTTIEGIQDRYGSMKEIYAVIDGKLQLVWERDGE